MSVPSFEPVEPGRLVAAVAELKRAGWRLVQIGATRLAEQVELTYSFDRALELKNLRLLLPAPGARVPSVSAVFWCAFLYENELHDLFDVQVDGMAVDFHGNFYKTAMPFPFAAAPRAKVAPTPRPAAAAAVPVPTPVAPTSAAQSAPASPVAVAPAPSPSGTSSNAATPAL